MEVKYPQITIKLVGEDGNAFAILARVDAALRKANISKEIRELFKKEATSKDYNHLLQVVMQWVNAE
ncbi:hypothetical protein [Helicobacter pullorum]|uniref:hypothetical protein n=1 Tax=Helicobacter pullorum TaxID=35818 RepID=UPI00255C658F|nr:hypothetical protein [Helicobacter pullorum]